MKKKTTKMRGMRLSEATYKAVVQAAKARDFATPSAFMRAAVEKELRGTDSTVSESVIDHLKSSFSELSPV